MIRPINCIMMGLAVVVGAFLAEGSVSFAILPNFVLGYFAGFFMTGAAMAANDYYDREIDAINEPMRPIPSGVMAPKEALYIALAFTLAGLTVAVSTGNQPNWQCLTVASVSWLIAVLYVTRGKRTGLPGNLLVSSCIALPLFYGSLVVGRGIRPTATLFVAMIFLSNTGREITKGIVDIEGDRQEGIGTIAALYGERHAAILAAIFFLSAIILTPLPLLLDYVSLWYLPPIVLIDVALIYTVIQLVKNPSRENSKKIKNRILLWFLIGLIAFILGTIQST